MFDASQGQAIMLVKATFFDEVGNVLFNPSGQNPDTADNKVVTAQVPPATPAGSTAELRQSTEKNRFKVISEHQNELSALLQEAGFDARKITQFTSYLIKTLNAINTESLALFLNTLEISFDRLKDHKQFNIPFSPEEIGLIIELSESEKNIIREACKKFYLTYFS